MNQFLNKKKGVVTAFTAIIMPVLILLVLVLSDIYIAKNAKQVAQNALQASCGCVLSQYSSYMKDEYALYGYQISDDQVQDIILETLKKSGISSGLYSMCIEEIEVERNRSILEYPVLFDQIIDIMQEDIFVSIINQTNERIKTFAKMKSVLKVLNSKMQIDELIGGLKNAHESLKQTIEQINTNQYYYDLMEMICTVEDIHQNILNLLSEPNQEQSQTLIDSLKQEALNVLKGNMDNLIYVLKEYNKKALNLIKEMKTTYDQVHMLSDGMKSIVDGIQDCPDYLEVLLKLCVDTVYEMEDSFSQGVFDGLERTFARNIDCLSNVVLEIVNTVTFSEKQSVKQVFNDAMEKYYDALYEPLQLDNFFFSVCDQAYEDQRPFWKQYAQELLSESCLEDNTIESFIFLISDNAEKVFSFDADTEKNTLKGIFSSLDDICGFLSKIKQDILFNEYIMLYLNSFTDNLKEVQSKKYLKCETEYLIFGNRDNNKNIQSCKAVITAMRFACNAIHVYTDLSKTAKANTLAAALGILDLWSGNSYS